MPEILFWLGVFALSLFVLIKASDSFIDAAEKISLSFGIPPFLIGITIVALGTSLPELVTSIVATLNNHSEIVVSNVVGSNIANVFLVLGISALVGRNISFDFKVNLADWAMFFGSAIILGITIWSGKFQIWGGVLCLLGIAIYLWSAFTRDNEKTEDNDEDKDLIDWKTYGLLIVSFVFIPISANYNIESIIKLATILNIGTEIITMSAVAIGTSLPELFVSISCIKKNNPEMAFGNVLGSNIFNIFVVMGIPVFFSQPFFGGSLEVPETVLNFSYWIMLLGTGLYYLILRDKKLIWWEGIILLSAYIFFIIKLF